MVNKIPGRCPEEEINELPLFDPDTIHPKEFNLVNAPRGSGKSVLLEHWGLFMAPKIVLPLAISHSENHNGFFENYFKIPKAFIFDQFDDSIIEGAFMRNIKLKENPPGFSFETHASTHIFMDDLQDVKGLWNNPSMRKLAKLGRHAEIGATFLSQYAPSIEKAERSQVDRIACLHDSNLSNRAFIQEMGFADWSWTEFNTYYKYYTRNFGALVYSKNAPEHLKFTHFTADPTISENIDNIQIQWHPNSSANEFSKWFVKEDVVVDPTDWNKAKFGASQLLSPYYTLGANKKVKKAIRR